MSKKNETCLYGLVAEFNDPADMLRAARQVREAGYTDVSAFTPYRIEGLNRALGKRKSILPWLVVGAIFLGFGAGFLLQYYTDVFSYPVNIGGRPFNSWPAFMIICFELAVLFGAFTAFGGMLVFSELPLPYHPIFNTPRYDLSSNDRFYLCIEVTDSRFNLQRTKQFLLGLGPTAVNEAQC